MMIHTHSTNNFNINTNPNLVQWIFCGPTLILATESKSSDYKMSDFVSFNMKQGK